jgi:hypothetical protein
MIVIVMKLTVMQKNNLLNMNLLVDARTSINQYLKKYLNYIIKKIKQIKKERL